MLIRQYVPKTADGYHAMQNINAKNLLEAFMGKGELVSFVGIKVHNEDGSVANGEGLNHIFKPAGNPDVEIKLFDKDGSLVGVKMEIDLNQSDAYTKTWLTYDAKSGDLVGTYMGKQIVVDVVKSGINTWTAHLDFSELDPLYDGTGHYGMEVYNSKPYGGGKEISSFIDITVNDDLISIA